MQVRPAVKAAGATAAAVEHWRAYPEAAIAHKIQAGRLRANTNPRELSVAIFALARRTNAPRRLSD